MNRPLLDVQDLHAGCGRAEVLHGLNLRAEAGSVVALMGVLPARGAEDPRVIDTCLGAARGAARCGGGA